MTIGVGVEGPSDRAFWEGVLHKHFRRLKFDIRNMNGREKLICQTPRLLETFRDAHYRAGFILVDRNASPCPSAVLSEFDANIQGEARKPMDQRFLSVCVAVRELEAWFLADAVAINALLPKATCAASPETGELNAERVLKDLWRQQYGSSALNKIDFAKRMAPRFNPDVASRHSASFKYFWTKIASKARR